jgi:hypothetical protein
MVVGLDNMAVGTHRITGLILEINSIFRFLFQLRVNQLLSMGSRQKAAIPSCHNATDVDSWRLHVTEIPHIPDDVSDVSTRTSNPPECENCMQELSNDEAASRKLDADQFLSVKEDRSNSIILSPICKDRIDSWRLHITEISPSTDSASMPSCHVPSREEQTPPNESLIYSMRRNIGIQAKSGLTSISCYEFSAPIDAASNNDGQQRASSSIRKKTLDAPRAEEINTELRNDHHHANIAEEGPLAGSRSVHDRPAFICSHGRHKKRCKDCKGAYICIHDRIKVQCRECGGAHFCVHGRRRTACKDCGGSMYCSHGRCKSRCKECGGVSVCCHGRRRSQCKECGGASVCCHGRRKSTCKACGGVSVCVHGRQKVRCKDCGRKPACAPN